MGDGKLGCLIELRFLSEQLQYSNVSLLKGDGVDHFQQLFEPFLVERKNKVRPLGILPYPFTSFIDRYQEYFCVLFDDGLHLARVVMNSRQEGHDATFPGFDVIEQNLPAVFSRPDHLDTSRYDDGDGADVGIDIEDGRSSPHFFYLSGFIGFLA